MTLREGLKKKGRTTVAQLEQTGAYTCEGIQSTGSGPCYGLFCFLHSLNIVRKLKVSSVQSYVTSWVLRPGHIASLKQAYLSQRERTLCTPSDATEVFPACSLALRSMTNNT